MVFLLLATVQGMAAINTTSYPYQVGIQREERNITSFSHLYTAAPDLPSWVFNVCCVYLSIVGSGGVFFNLSIFVMYFKNKKLWTDFNMLLMNLILAELLVSLFGIPV